jgi:hypothetical protein
MIHSLTFRVMWIGFYWFPPEKIRAPRIPVKVDIKGLSSLTPIPLTWTWWHTRSILVMVTMKIKIFWDVTLCSLIDFYLEDGESTFFRNFGNDLPDYTASHPGNVVKYLTSLTTLELRHSFTFRGPKGKRAVRYYSFLGDLWRSRYILCSNKLSINRRRLRTRIKGKYFFLFRLEVLPIKYS